MKAENEIQRWRLGVTCIIFLLAGSALEAAHAERWVQASQTDLHVWYDADNVRPTGDGLIGVWVSTGPNRTNTDVGGRTSYPAYSIIDCKQRKAGSKISLDSGEALMPYASDSGMGKLIEKLCS